MNHIIVSLLAAGAVLISPLVCNNSPHLTERFLSSRMLLVNDAANISTTEIQDENRNQERNHDTLAQKVYVYYIEKRISEYKCNNISDTKLASLIEKSDNYCGNKTLFTQAAQQLLDQDRCTETDFAMNRGWVRAPDRGIFYFSIYCDDFNEIVYLDATNGTLY